MKLPLHAIRLQPNVPAGLNILVVAYFAHRMRTTPTEWDEPDFRVTVEQNGDGWTLTDGRHRLLAAWVAGRSDIMCNVET